MPVPASIHVFVSTLFSVNIWLFYLQPQSTCLAVTAFGVILIDDIFLMKIHIFLFLVRDSRTFHAQLHLWCVMITQGSASHVFLVCKSRKTRCAWHPCYFQVFQGFLALKETVAHIQPNGQFLPVFGQNAEKRLEHFSCASKP